jgi:alginate O-acetyltransferase complex protein AlgI
MSYTVDLYRGRVQPVSALRDFGTFVALFPQLIAGPIARYAHLQEQLANREHTLPRFAHGLYTFSLGLGKKLLVADTLAALAAPIFAAGNPGFIDAWVSMLLFSGQIYFDFSGYCDMVIGLGRMFGFEFPENFNRPYCATSFSNF